MRKLSISSLTLLIALTACADRSGSITSVVDGPQAPINEPDTGVFQPGAPNSGGSAAGSTTSSSQENGGGSNGAGTGESGGGQAGQGAGAGAENGGGTPNTGENGGGGNGPGSGPSGGEPVPEPSTLLLVGSGLAGIALLRRRRTSVLPQSARD